MVLSKWLIPESVALDHPCKTGRFQNKGYFLAFILSPRPGFPWLAARLSSQFPGFGCFAFKARRVRAYAHCCAMKALMATSATTKATTLPRSNVPT